MGRIRVLVVDDHASARDGIRGLLGHGDNFEIVAAAAGGEAAVGQVKELAPDVIVMDTAAPGMDAVEATRRIKQRQPRAKVLALSRWDDTEHVLSAIRAGVDGYLPATVTGSELVSAINTVYAGGSCLYPAAAAALVKECRNLVPETPTHPLAGREREVFQLIVDGHTSREIAKMLAISLKTVLGHRLRMMKKLGSHNLAQLVKRGIRDGLVAHTGA